MKELITKHCRFFVSQYSSELKYGGGRSFLVQVHVTGFNNPRTCKNQNILGYTEFCFIIAK